MTHMTSERITVLFRVQCTLFCLFYCALLFPSIVYFRHRLSFITDSLGTEAVLPGILTFARSMHHPVILAFASVAPIAVVIFAWRTKPNVGILFAQIVLMFLSVVLVFIPPIATEITTSNILKVIHTGAKERGLIR